MVYRIVLLVMAVLLAGPIQAEAIRVDVHDVPVRTVVEGLARSGGINLIVDDSVQGNLTMCLTGVTVQEALQAIADSQNLRYDTNGTIYTLTAGRKAATAKAIHIFPLAYAEPEEACQAVQAILPEANVRCHEGTNSLVIGGSHYDAAEVRRLIKGIDVPPRQVKVEVEVAALNQDAMRELGINWDWQTAEGGPGHQNSFAYAAQIHALETQGKARVLARPHMMASNGREAKILIGDRIPVLTEHLQNGQTTTTTEYTDAGIKLIYTPRIHADGSVTARLQAEVSTPVLVPELKAYRFVTRQAETQVRIEDGKTLIIGGLINKEDIDNFRKIPILGDLPIIGRLFRNHYVSSRETEVVIMVKTQLEK